MIPFVQGTLTGLDVPFTGRIRQCIEWSPFVERLHFNVYVRSFYNDSGSDCTVGTADASTGQGMLLNDRRIGASPFASIRNKSTKFSECTSKPHEVRGTRNRSTDRAGTSRLRTRTKYGMRRNSVQFRSTTQRTQPSLNPI